MKSSAPILRQILFCLAIFLAAFMSFLVEPLIGKLATAQLGSAASIWTVILLFFQLVLLLGYTITFLLSKLPLRIQIPFYMVLLAAALPFLHFPSAEQWQSVSLENPTVDLITLLFASIGLPVTMLYTVSGTIQNYCGISGWRNPYILFSLSNFACLSSLLAYPFLLEPRLSLSSTCNSWLYGCAAALLSAALSALLMLTLSIAPTIETQDNGPSAPDSETKPMPLTKLLNYVFLSAMGCITLIAYTAYLTADVAPLPLLWIAPLCIYLLTFIICFKDTRYYNPACFALIAPALWITEPFFKSTGGIHEALILAVVLCFCMMFHGELALRKPDRKDLTAFYLAIAIGGVLGGIFENFIAPAIFNQNLEIAMLGLVVMVLSGITLYKRTKATKKTWVRVTDWMIIIFLASGVGLLSYLRFFVLSNTILLSRNFYGCLKVSRSDNGDRTFLIHGSTTHGFQYTDPEKLDIPTTYYSRTTACGAVFSALHKLNNNSALNAGIIGLGAGTIACYGEPGDRFCFYEIDSKIEEIARKYFSFLNRSHAKTEVILGDARKTLEHQAPQSYDLLIVDAFSGDSVPTHLLTAEAFQIYLKHLKPNGVLMLHCSNRYLNLPAVITNVAGSMHLPGLLIKGREAIYTVVCKQSATEQTIKQCAKQINKELEVKNLSPKAQIGVWTDDYVNLISAIEYDSR